MDKDWVPVVSTDSEPRDLGQRQFSHLATTADPEPANEDAPDMGEGASAAEDGAAADAVSGGGDDAPAVDLAPAVATAEAEEAESAVPSLGGVYDQWAAGALPPSKVQALARAPREPVSGLRWWQYIERVRGIETHEPPRPMPHFFVVAPAAAGGGASASGAVAVDVVVELDGGEPFDYADGGAANDENAPPPPPPSSLAALYDRWAAGKLDAATEARLADAPREPGSTLRWWQWVERHRGVELHDPPRAVPRFQSEVDDHEPPRSCDDFFSLWKCTLGPLLLFSCGPLLRGEEGAGGRRPFAGGHPVEVSDPNNDAPLLVFASWRGDDDERAGE